MTKIDRFKTRRKMPSMPSLIAWLSVCLLAAAWGHTLDQHWQAVWRQTGAFGLAAAVGLGALERMRGARSRSEQQDHDGAHGERAGATQPAQRHG